MSGYVLKAGKGRSYLWSPNRYLFTIKAVGDEMDIAFIEFTTERAASRRCTRTTARTRSSTSLAAN